MASKTAFMNSSRGNFRRDPASSGSPTEAAIVPRISGRKSGDRAGSLLVRGYEIKGPGNADRHDGDGRAVQQQMHPGLEGLHLARPRPFAFGKHEDGMARFHHLNDRLDPAGGDAFLIDRVDVDGG